MHFFNHFGSCKLGECRIILCESGAKHRLQKLQLNFPRFVLCNHRLDLSLTGYPHLSSLTVVVKLCVKENIFHISLLCHTMIRIGSSLSPKLQLPSSFHILLDPKTQLYSELCVAFYFTHPSYYIAIKKSLVHSVWFAIWYDYIGRLSAMMWHLHWRKARNYLGWPSISDSRVGCFQLILHLRNSFDPDYCHLL